MKIIFAGTPQFAIPSLMALIEAQYEVCAVYTKPDKEAGRGLKLTESAVKKAAQSLNLPIYQPHTLKDDAAQKEIAQFGADVFVDVAYGLLLPKEVLAMPARGCINLHPSLLPRWRGAAPIQRAILAGDTVTGVTIMLMDEGLDTGDILKQELITIEKTDTAHTLECKLSDLGAKTLISVLNELKSNHIKATKQDNSKSNYAEKIEKNEAQINWNQSAIEIDRMIRAFNPRPIAYSSIDQNTLRVFKSAPLEENTNFPPGTIIKSDKNGIDVAAKQGVLRLIEIQLENSKAMKVYEMLNSKKDLFMAGKRFV